MVQSIKAPLGALFLCGRMLIKMISAVYDVLRSRIDVNAVYKKLAGLPVLTFIRNHSSISYVRR